MKSGVIVGRGSEGVVRVIDETTVVKCCRQSTDGFHIGVFGESSILAQYRHPNLMTPVGEHPFAFSDLDFTIQLPYYRRSLANYQPTDIVSFAYEMLSALAFLHRNRIIHTDVKPNNIMFDDEGSAHLIDYGQSVRDYGQEKSLEVQASMWRAPEIILQNTHYTTAIDIWSLGVILHNLICPKGSSLNNGGGNWYVMWQYCRRLPYTTPQAPRERLLFSRIMNAPEAAGCEVAKLELPDSCPLELQELVRRCLTFNYQTRISAIEALNLPLFNSYTHVIGEVLPFHRGQPVGKDVWKYFEQVFKYLRTLPCEAQVLSAELYSSVLVRQPGEPGNLALACAYIAAQQLGTCDLSQDGFFAERSCPWEQLSTAVREVTAQLRYFLHPLLPPVDIAREYHECEMSEERQLLYRAERFSEL